MPYQVDDTVTLETTFAVGDPAVLTDPTTVALTVVDPVGASTTYTYALSDVIKDSTGAYSKVITADTAGIWTWRWVGTGDAAGVDEGTFAVDVSLATSPGLCTLDDVKLARRGMPSVLDDLITALISRASEAIIIYTRRRFAVDAAPSTRVFDMSWTSTTGEIAIDDLSSAPTAISTLDVYGDHLATIPTTDESVVLLPRNRFPGQPITGIRMRPRNIWGHELSVTGVWGFPSIPESVREAAITTVVEWLKDDQALTVQSPDQFEPGTPAQRMLPLKARDLLRLYRKQGIG